MSANTKPAGKTLARNLLLICAGSTIAAFAALYLFNLAELAPS